MDDYKLIGMAVIGLGGALGFYMKLRSFEKSLMTEIEDKMNDKCEGLEKMINAKADSSKMEAIMASIQNSVGTLNQSMTEFMERQNKHVETLYDEDKAQRENLSKCQTRMNEKITEIKIEQARNEQH
jgi:hypothetical protein